MTAAMVQPPDRSPREALRARELALVPSHYSPLLHLATPSAVGLAAIALAAVTVRDPGLDDALLALGTAVVANAAEWRAHKSVLHRRVRGLTRLFERHTPHHHALFPAEHMAVRSRREWRFVLLPGWGILLILAITTPITAALWALGRADHAAVFLATCAAYVVSYEWLHLAYHLPPDGPIGRLWLVRRLRAHHATHHRPELMQRWNFNVTVPLWDVVRRTRYPGD